MSEFILKIMQRILNWAKQSSDIDYKAYKEMKEIYESTKSGKGE